MRNYKLKTSAKYFIGGWLTYIIPILCFGSLRSPYVLLKFIASLPTIYFLIHKKFNKKIFQGSSRMSMLSYITISLFLSLMGLSPFEGHINNSILSISLTYSNVFGYWFGYTLTTIFFEMYLKYKNIEKMADFDNDSVKVERDNKIDAILSKF